MSFRTPSIAALAALLTAAAALAQPPREVFREELEVTEVLLDVVVTDASGNVILGLDKDDFVVEDGERTVDLTSATFYSNRRFVESAAAAERHGITPAEVPVDRYFILFFHDQRKEDASLTGQHLDAVRWASRWVSSEMLPNDWVAVLTYDHKLKVHQDFTTDAAALQRALEGVAKGTDPDSNWPSRFAEASGPSLRKNLPQGRELRRATPRIYSGLQRTAEAAGYITGRKNLLLFSIGFGRLNDFGTYLPDERYYPPLMETLNDNNVAVYAISLIENVADETAAQGVLGNSLSLLANDTGGRFYFNFANFRDPLRQVAEDNNGYYLLSYSARHPAGSRGYQEVQVSTRNPEFKVRARKGYRYGTGDTGSG